MGLGALKVVVGPRKWLDGGNSVTVAYDQPSFLLGGDDMTAGRPLWPCGPGLRIAQTHQVKVSLLGLAVPDNGGVQERVMATHRLNRRVVGPRPLFIDARTD